MHLKDFSLYEKHYNQLIASDFLRQVLLDANYSQVSENKQNKQKRQVHNLDFEDEIVEKQVRTEHAYEIEVKKNTCEIGIQTDKVGVQVNKETREFGVQVFDIMSHTLESYINLLQAQLDVKINEIENLQKQLNYVYDYVIEKDLTAEKNKEMNSIDLAIKNQKGVGV
ncbi:19499_t:CDS:2 [Racocetra fulgida]|uniref:19499_t:CDS:1 n=1 Tax=Racocetra fulgida TaxID=60492 RepID=A0A9N8WR90_9GLOM|nr:19499_t:CDS:2 [Racocetra fulgida]